MIRGGSLLLTSALLSGCGRLGFDPPDNLIYVATDGDDARSCAEARDIASPKRTLSGGAQCLAPGLSLVVRAGEYAESLDDALPSGSASEPVIVRSYEGELVEVRPASGVNVVRIAGNRSYIVIEDLVIDGAGVEGDAVNISGTGSPVADGAHHIALRGCEIKNAPASGVMLEAYTHHNELTNLRVHDNQVFAVIVATDSTANLIEGNDVYNHPSNHAIILNCGGTDNNVVRNNRVHDNAWGITLYCGGYVGTVVSGNLVWANQGGITVAYGGSNVAVYNNIVWSNTSTGIMVHTRANANRVDHNTLFANGDGLVFSTYEPTGTEPVGNVARNNIVFASVNTDVVDLAVMTTLANNLVGVDPVFVDSAAAKFTPHSTSPAVDTGLPMPDITSDQAGVSRPQGSGYDIGALEAQSQ